MDPNKPIIPTPPPLPQTPTVTTSPTTETTPPMTPTSETTPPQSNNSSIQVTPNPTGSKKWLYIIGGLVVLVLIAGGGYWYYQNNMANKKTSANTQNTPSGDVAALNKDLDAIKTPEVDSDFTAIDKDLGSL